MDQIALKINGMTCGHCVSSVTRALQRLDGVSAVNVEVGAAVVGYDPNVLATSRIAQVIEDEGYVVAGSR